jgi:hypothetical protein
MRVLFGWATMRCPARVSQTIITFNRGFAEHIFQITQFATGTTHGHLAAFIDNSDSGGIISAIFQTAQPFNYNGHNLLISDITDNPTHNIAPEFSATN